MAIVGGYTGLVTSWGSPNDIWAGSSGGANGKGSEFELSISADELDSTAFNTTLLGSDVLPGLRMWEGTINLVRPTPIVGYQGGISFSNGTVSAVRSYSVQLQNRVLPATVFGGTDVSNRWKSFIPGLWDISGSFEGYIENGNSYTILPPVNSTSSATMTLTVSTGVTIAFSAFVTRNSNRVAVGGETGLSCNFRGVGTVTLVGATNPFGAAGSLALPTASSLVLKAAEVGTTDLTFTGSAFPKSLSLECTVDGQVTQTVGFQGSAALTTSTGAT